MNASLETKETNLVATEERVIMQTATIDLENGKDEENGIKQSVQVLLDSRSQRKYILKDITDKLQLTPTDKNLLTIYTFGTTKPKCIETLVVEVTMILKSGFTRRMLSQTLLVQLKEHHSDLKPSNKHCNNMNLPI